MKEPYTLSCMSEGDNLDPTMIGCPACAGVLALQADDASEHLQCSVGHTFSFETLLEAKEEELEKALCSAVALLANLDMISRKLLERSGMQGGGRLSEALRKRMTQARLQAKQLRAMVEDKERPNLSFTIH